MNKGDLLFGIAIGAFVVCNSAVNFPKDWLMEQMRDFMHKVINGEEGVI